MVHGLEGNSNDLRLWKTSLEQLYPLGYFEYLLCQSNHNLTHEHIEEQGKRITDEVADYLLNKEVLPTKISWIGHRWVIKNTCWPLGPDYFMTTWPLRPEFVITFWPLGSDIL